VSDRLTALRKAPGIVRIHGHRGARGVLPENTLIGFQNTFDIGVDVVELDVLTTADDVPVITHYPRLMAASTRDAAGRWLNGQSPAIRDLTLTELKAHDVGGLRAGTDYAARYPDQAFLDHQRIPTLAELAEMVSRPPYEGVWLNIEIKSKPSRPEFTPPLPNYVSGILAVLNRFRLAPRVILQSFDWRILREVAVQAPDLPRSHLSYLDRPDPPMDPNIIDGSDWMAGAKLGDAGGSLPDLIADLGGAVWSPYHSDIRAEDVARAQARGLIVNAWTANSAAEIQAAIDAGVDGLITDYPARAQRILLAQGLTWRG
jgi:glycerophosphoryl diester phosphodiesterase